MNIVKKKNVLMLFCILFIVGCFDQKEKSDDRYDDPLVNSHRVLHVTVNTPSGFNIEVAMKYETITKSKSCMDLSLVDGQYKPKNDYCYYNLSKDKNDVFIPVKYPKKSKCKWIVNSLNVAVVNSEINAKQITFTAYAKNIENVKNVKITKPVYINYQKSVNYGVKPYHYFYDPEINMNEMEKNSYLTFYGLYQDTIDVELHVVLDSNKIIEINKEYKDR